MLASAAALTVTCCAAPMVRRSSGSGCFRLTRATPRAARPTDRSSPIPTATVTRADRRRGESWRAVSARQDSVGRVRSFLITAVGQCRSVSRLWSVVLVGSVVAVGAPAVAVQRAELNNGQLCLEGTATANRDLTVDGVVMGRSASDGRFRIERSPFTPPADCTVDVNDGSPTAAVARLAGCV